MFHPYLDFSAKRHAFAPLALVFVLTSCSRRDEGGSDSTQKPQAKAAPQSAVTTAMPATPASSSQSVAAESEPQPDFLKHPPIHLKKPCASSSSTVRQDDGNRCVTLTLHCAELDRDESIWLATSPAITKIRLPEGAKGLRVTVEDEVSATVCCKTGAADRGSVKAQLRLFTNEVVGSTEELECL